MKRAAPSTAPLCPLRVLDDTKVWLSPRKEGCSCECLCYCCNSVSKKARLSSSPSSLSSWSSSILRLFIAAMCLSLSVLGQKKERVKSCNLPSLLKLKSFQIFVLILIYIYVVCKIYLLRLNTNEPHLQN